jgi:ABC-type sulfate transport system substrate-binding protein
MVSIDDFGGWEQATQDYFSEDGLYEQVKKLLEDE